MRVRKQDETEDKRASTSSASKVRTDRESYGVDGLSNLLGTIYIGMYSVCTPYLGTVYLCSRVICMASVCIRTSGEARLGWMAGGYVKETEWWDSVN